jgi:hypothetical protein
VNWADQTGSLFVLAIPIACITWTVTHEEIFREPRDWCAARSRRCRTLVLRKFFYIPTCEYCFSHYVTVVVLAVTRFTLIYPGWRGYLAAGFSLVWIANVYMSLFARLRLEIREERIEVAAAESHVEPDRHE